jgi:hypothetical protein
LVSNSCGIYEDIKRFLTGIMQKLKFFHIRCGALKDNVLHFPSLDTIHTKCLCLVFVPMYQATDCKTMLFNTFVLYV